MGELPLADKRQATTVFGEIPARYVRFRKARERALHATRVGSQPKV
jgi:hypothetical protein